MTEVIFGSRLSDGTAVNAISLAGHRTRLVVCLPSGLTQTTEGDTDQIYAYLAQIVKENKNPKNDLNEVLSNLQQLIAPDAVMSLVARMEKDAKCGEQRKNRGAKRAIVSNPTPRKKVIKKTAKKTVKKASKKVSKKKGK